MYDIYRRVFMIAVLPLVGSDLERGFVGLLVSAVAAVLAREIKPFTNTNVSELLYFLHRHRCLIVLNAISLGMLLTGQLALGGGPVPDMPHDPGGVGDWF